MELEWCLQEFTIQGRENPFHAPKSYENPRFTPEKVHLPFMPLLLNFAPFYATTVISC
jgi:hypothetical protein